MPASFDIRSASGNYHVEIDSGLTAGALARYPDAILLVDARLAAGLPTGSNSVIAVEAKEENKSLEAMAPLIVRLRELGAQRKSHLLAIGGGIVQDIATFVASIYMRGVPWSYLPTTLLGMVDSCIGGKSSINVGCYKNLVGNFHPPREILIDLNYLATLDIEQCASGLCEAAKICYARSAEAFRDYLALSPSPVLMPEQMEAVVIGSLLAKKWFIEIDEFDQNERLILNYGHTFGHALESASNFAIPHGIAVGVGIHVAHQHALSQARLDAAGLERSQLLTDHLSKLLVASPRLSEILANIDLGKVLASFENDKKHQATSYRVVLPVQDGRLALDTPPRDQATRQSLHVAYSRALNHIMNS